MGEIVSEIAHELNQPLSAIVNFARGGANRLRAGELDLHGMHEVLTRVGDQGLRAAGLIRRIRAFARRDTFSRQDADVNALITTAAEIVTAGQSVRRWMRFDLQPDVPTVRADTVQIEQVLINLIRNAIEAGRPDDEEIVVETRRIDGTAVGILVRDRGAGLSDEVREHLFEPFYSTKQDGLGMGLAISRSIVEAHGGTIRAEPNAGRGTTFRVVLPVENPLSMMSAGKRKPTRAA
jgi:signal transduction histidine kinase